MIETLLFEEPSARARFRTAPCLEEREQYLFYLMRKGYDPAYLRSVSGLLLRIIHFLGLVTLRTVELTKSTKRPVLGLPIAGRIAEE